MKCIECGLEKHHRMDCGSKILMMDYEAFVSKLEHLPEILLNDLFTRSSVEMENRRVRKSFVSERTESLFDMYVRKEEE